MKMMIKWNAKNVVKHTIIASVMSLMGRNPEFDHICEICWKEGDVNIYKSQLLCNICMKHEKKKWELLTRDDFEIYMMLEGKKNE
jgi:hypothetical protein